MRTLLLAVTVATILMSQLLHALAPRQDGVLPRNFHSPVLAAELVRNAHEIEQVYGTAAQSGRCATAQPGATQPQGCAFIAMLRWNTWVDFLYIPSYAAMFFLLGRLFSGRFGAFVMALAVIAALADITENIGMFRAMSEPATDALAIAIRVPSLVKWTALGLIWLTLFGLFQRASPKGTSLAWRIVESATGGFYFASGIACLAGVVISDLLRLTDRETSIETALILIAPAILLQLVVLWRDAGFLRRLGLAAPDAAFRQGR
jgi:hypothetical protein